jgi:hypothetical protein
LILSGYSFNDGHLNDTIVNALRANPTAMVLGLMYGDYMKGDQSGAIVESYPEAYKLAKKQHNLNIWTFDKSVIGTNVGEWAKIQLKDDNDSDLANFITTETIEGEIPATRSLVKLGDFAIFTHFLKKIIGAMKGHQDV